MRIEGVRKLERKLLKLEPKIGKKVVRQAVRKAAKPILAAAKSNVPVESGELKRNLKIKALKRKKHRFGVMIGTGLKWFTGDQFYAAFVEFGTGTRPARPYLRPAFDTKRQSSEQILKTELKNGIKAAAKGN